jgi:glycosyltransferase involved in cell wall biosynthesis
VTVLRDRLEPTVLLPEGGDEFRGMLEERGIPTITVPSLTKRYLFAFSRIVKRGNFDLVYANTPDGTSRLAFAAARLAGARYICHVRALGWNTPWTKLAHLRFADAVIAVSRAAADSVVRFVRPSRLHVVYNGIDVGEGARRAATADLRQLAGWPADSLVLMGLANVCERKGQGYAVAAMDSLRHRAPGAHLALIGRLDREPAYAADLQKQIGHLGLENRVCLLGFREDGASLLQQADILVHTAVADPHPRAVLEAMAARLPVVGFAVDGVAETVVHGETGLLVPSEDTAALASALGLLAEDAELRAGFGAAGLRRVTEVFSDRVTADRVGQVIEDVLTRG